MPLTPEAIVASERDMVSIRLEDGIRSLILDALERKARDTENQLLQGHLTLAVTEVAMAVADGATRERPSQDLHSQYMEILTGIFKAREDESHDPDDRV